MPRNSGPAKRDLFPGSGAGKGDADRSPGWREQYDNIDWPHNVEGAEQVSSKRIRKVYGQRDTKPDAKAPNIKIL